MRGAFLSSLLLLTGSCADEPVAPAAAQSAGPGAGHDAFVMERKLMVRRQILNRGVTDPRVLEAMEKVPRHLFVPDNQVRHAYEDRPLRIEGGQTISQPYIVALMSKLIEAKPGARVLEVGTGSGYQAAVLSAMGLEVYSIEIVEVLAKKSVERLARAGHGRVKVRHGDGYAGWPDKAPFDAIMITAAPPRVPEPLKQQLKVGGRLVLPLGEAYQELIVIRRTKQGYQRRSVIPVRFVPMTGRIQNQNQD